MGDKKAEADWLKIKKKTFETEKELLSSFTG